MNNFLFWGFEKLISLYRFLKKKHVKKSLAQCGENVIIQEPSDFDIYANISLGSNIYIGPESRLWATESKIIIKDHVILGPRVTIIGGDHRFDLVGTYIIDIKSKLPENDLDVCIEEDVWIGCNVTILKGVTIGRGAIVSAGSLVCKDVEPYSIVGGVPARTLKKRFTTEELVRHEQILGI